jgi:hypothetical protein
LLVRSSEKGLERQGLKKREGGGVTVNEIDPDAMVGISSKKLYSQQLIGCNSGQEAYSGKQTQYPAPSKQVEEINDVL